MEKGGKVACEARRSSAGGHAGVGEIRKSVYGCCLYCCILTVLTVVCLLFLPTFVPVGINRISFYPMVAHSDVVTNLKSVGRSDVGAFQRRGTAAPVLTQARSSSSTSVRES